MSRGATKSFLEQEETEITERVLQSPLFTLLSPVQKQIVEYKQFQNSNGRSGIRKNSVDSGSLTTSATGFETGSTNKKGCHIGHPCSGEVVLA
jgi:hypothetical protein